MKRLISASLLATTAATFHASPVAADIHSGNDLYDACTRDSTFQKGLCAGLISGYLDGQRAGHTKGVVLSTSAIFEGDRGPDGENFWREVARVESAMEAAGTKASDCLPKKSTVRQVTDVVVKWLEKNPEKRAESMSFAINVSMSEAFGYPCNGGTEEP